MNSSVTLTSLDPPYRVVPRASGATPLARYRAGQPSSLRGPLVLIIRNDLAIDYDQVRVLKAELRGRVIAVEVEHRRHMGVATCTACTGPTVPLLEIELGSLAAGGYTIEIDTTVLSFTDQNHPERAGNAERRPRVTGSVSIGARRSGP